MPMCRAPGHRMIPPSETGCRETESPLHREPARASGPTHGFTTGQVAAQSRCPLSPVPWKTEAQTGAPVETPAVGEGLRRALSPRSSQARPWCPSAPTLRTPGLARTGPALQGSPHCQRSL